MEGNREEESKIIKKGIKFKHVHNEDPSHNVSPQRGLRGASDGPLTCMH